MVGAPEGLRVAHRRALLERRLAQLAGRPSQGDARQRLAALRARVLARASAGAG